MVVKVTHAFNNVVVIVLKLLDTDQTCTFSCSLAWADVVVDESFKMDSPRILPPFEFLYENGSSGSPSSKCLSSSAVMPSLPLTIRWLRDCVKENPSLRLQVRMPCPSSFNLKQIFIVKCEYHLYADGLMTWD